MSTTEMARGRSEGTGRGIQSVEIGARLLDVLIETRQSMRLKELSQLAGLSPSKARMYLVSLMRTGLIEQHVTTGLYAPGPKALRLGMIALGQNELFRSARELVHGLGRETGQPVLLSAWDGVSPVIVASSESPDALPIAFRVGVRTPLWTTATGSVFLAFLPRPLADLLMAEACPPEARPAVASAVEQAGRDGIMYFEVVRLNAEVTLTGYGAIAAPIFGREGALEFVVTMLAAKRGKTPRRLIDLLKTRARAISEAQREDAGARIAQPA